MLDKLTSNSCFIIYITYEHSWKQCYPLQSFGGYSDQDNTKYLAHFWKIFFNCRQIECMNQGLKIFAIFATNKYETLVWIHIKDLETHFLCVCEQTSMYNVFGDSPTFRHLFSCNFHISIAVLTKLNQYYLLKY